MPSCIITWLAVNPVKVYGSMTLTEPGIETEPKLQKLNALLLISTTVSGIERFSKWHLWKALRPITVIPDGIAVMVRLEHPSNALSGISVMALPFPKLRVNLQLPFSFTHFDIVEIISFVKGAAQ